MNKLKQYTHVEREELVTKWRLSGLGAAFSPEHQINIDNFYSFSCASAQRKKKEKSVSFTAIRASCPSGVSNFSLEQLLQEKGTALFNLEKSLSEREQEIERLKEQLHLLRHHQFAKKVRAPIAKMA